MGKAHIPKMFKLIRKTYCRGHIISNQERDLARYTEVIPTGVRKITGGLWLLPMQFSRGPLDYGRVL